MTFLGKACRALRAGVLAFGHNLLSSDRALAGRARAWILLLFLSPAILSVFPASAQEVTISIGDGSGTEGTSSNGKVSFPVTLSGPVSSPVYVAWKTSAAEGQTATPLRDMTLQGWIEIPAGQTSKTLDVITTKDSIVEEDETFTVTLSALPDTPFPAGVVLSDTAASAVGTITNDDSATLTIEDASASEGNAVIFRVTLRGRVQDGLTVTPSYMDGTAAGSGTGADYMRNTTAISFLGQRRAETQFLRVATIWDPTVEADETFTVGLTVDGMLSGVTATDMATGTITNDDSAAVSIADANAFEGNALTFTATLGKAVQGGFTVTPSYTDGTAVSTGANADYTQNTASLTFAGTAGEQQTFTVATSQNTLTEGDKTLTVGLTVSGAPSGVTAADTATGTIRDDDSASLSIQSVSADEGNALTFTVTLNLRAVPGGLTVTPTYRDGTATSTGAGADYTRNTAALTFAGTAGEQHSFTVSTTEDNLVERDETFTVGLSVSGTAQVIGAGATAIGTIANDDEAMIGAASTHTVTENVPTVNISVFLSRAVSTPVTVGYATSVESGQTATSGTDFTAESPGTITIPAGRTVATIPVTIHNSPTVEEDETFTVTLSAPVGGFPNGVSLSNSAASTEVTITDDDSATLSIGDGSGAEGTSSNDKVNFPVTLSTAASMPITVNYTTSVESGQTATSGTDFEAASGSVTIPAGKTSATISVSTIADTLVEGDETFTVTLSAPQDGFPSRISLNNSAASAEGTIENDDSASLSTASASATEGNDLSFTVTLSAPVDRSVTVVYRTLVTADQTATFTADVESASGALVIPAGETTGTVSLKTVDDSTVEGDETFTLDLIESPTVPFPAEVSLDSKKSSAVGTISDNDSATLSIDDASASEGDSMTFTVTLDKAVQGGLTVTPKYTDGTASSSGTGADYTKNTTALAFSGTVGETKTFTVATTEDTTVEVNEAFTVGLTVSDAPAGVTATATGTGTITNDDAATLSVVTQFISEGVGTGSVKILLSNPVSAPVTANYATSVESGQTATSGTDFTSVSAGTVTIPAGDVWGSASLTIINDTIVEGDETLTVALSAPQGGFPDNVSLSSTTGSGILIILDEDSAVLSIADVSADEGTGLTFTVTVDKAVQGGFTVTPKYTDGT
ncbi:MAG: hypothetical protein F4Z15_01090, partial [Gammaproteobacteria bacterium]|nr:hypothetical protein [Gammaproteobacteria bacterium]